MTTATNKFQRLTLQQALGNTCYGENIFQSLLYKKEWIVLSLIVPYFNFQSPTCAPTQVDIFSELTTDELYQLQHNPNTLFMFNYSWEGTSYKEYNFWEMLTYSALKNNIPLAKIFFISSNLKDEEQYDVWQKAMMPYHRINVIVFDFFSNYCAHQLQFLEYYNICHAVNKIKENHKLFLSMNRRLRTMRVYTIYKIFESKIFKNTMMSYDQLELIHIDGTHPSIKLGVNVSSDIYKQLIDSSPSTLDFSNFNDNWAGFPHAASVPVTLFEKTVVSLVSETLFDTYDSSSLFYSEKTFKAMIYYHPIMIFGQPGLNMSLEKIGFKNYSNYFDLSFDHIENHATRIDLQVAQLEILNDKLACMTGDQRVDWVMQDRSTLEHNKEALRAQDFNKKKLKKLIDIVKSITE